MKYFTFDDIIDNKKRYKIISQYTGVTNKTQSTHINIWIKQLCNLAKNHDVYVYIAQKKQKKEFRDFGWYDTLENGGVNVIYCDDLYKDKLPNYDAINEIAKQKFDLIIAKSIPNKTFNGKFKENIKRIFYDKVEPYFPYKYTEVQFKKTLPLIIACLNNPDALLLHQITDPDNLDFALIGVKNPIINTFLYVKPPRKVAHFKETRLEKTYYDHIFNEIKNYNKDKSIDFTFGFTCDGERRKSISALAVELENENKDWVFYKKDYYTKVNNIITREDYHKQICKTKVTMVIPAYDKKEFSINRWSEAIFCNCIPFIAADDKHYNKYKEELKTIFELNEWSEVFSFMTENDLIIPYSRVNRDYVNSIINRYDELLKEYKKWEKLIIQ